jgi:KipI family sensor histidine kinase inhibitor
VTVTVHPYGDGALLAEVEDLAAAHRLYRALKRSRSGGHGPPQVTDIVNAARSVVVRFEPGTDRSDLVEQWVRRLAAAQESSPTPTSGTTLGIPVIFDGPDLEEVAEAAGMTPASVIDRLSVANLEVAFLGFSPGFPYLVGLPPELASIPRRSTPRTSVPAGSVAIGGGFASVYPQSTPGGWQLLGRTSLALFDPDRPPYARLRPGDSVRLDDWTDRLGRTRGQAGPPPILRPRLQATGSRYVEVVKPGVLSLIEDAGRRSVAALGIPACGPADTDAMRLANRLVGNPDDSATIEVTVIGPTLRFVGPAHLAVVGTRTDGVEVRIDGLAAPSDTVLPIRHGQEVAIGGVRGGLRAYVAVAGGLTTPVMVGSRSTDMLCGLGPAPLAVGDQLDLGVPTRPHGQLSPPVEATSVDLIRIIDGPHPFQSSERERLTTTTWTVGRDSNRIGIRLHAPAGAVPREAAGISSTAMITGAIQVPPDGEPIILMPDHATVGGYPVIACVIAADRPKLGQLRPGDMMTFSTVDPDEARGQYRHQERALDGRVSGWFPTEAGT